MSLALCRCVSALCIFVFVACSGLFVRGLYVVLSLRCSSASCMYVFRSIMAVPRFLSQGFIMMCGLFLSCFSAFLSFLVMFEWVFV